MTEHVNHLHQVTSSTNSESPSRSSPAAQSNLIDFPRRDRGAVTKSPNRRRNVRLSPSVLSSHSALIHGLLTPRTSIGSQPDHDDLPRLTRLVSPGLLEPFATWPITRTPHLDENFEFLVHSFGPSVFGYERNDLGFDIFKSQAQFCLNDPAAFHSIMTIVAMRRDQVAGRTIPGFAAIQHRVEALRLINERFATGDVQACLTPGSIFAVSCLTGISRQWNAVGRDEFNSGLNQLILRKGGFSVLHEEAPVLEMSIYGLTTITSGMLRPNLHTVTEMSSVDEPIDIKTQLYGLLGFIRSVQSLRHKETPQLRELGQAFPPNSPALALLTDSATHPGILDPNQAIVESRLRSSFLLYVFSVLLYCSPVEISRVIKHVYFVLEHAHIWKRSLRMLAWAIVADTKEGILMFPKPAWQSYELLCAITNLDDSLQKDIQTWLLGILTGQRLPRDAAEKIMQHIRASMFSSARNTNALTDG